MNEFDWNKYYKWIAEGNKEGFVDTLLELEGNQNIFTKDQKEFNENFFKLTDKEKNQ